MSSLNNVLLQVLEYLSHGLRCFDASLLQKRVSSRKRAVPQTYTARMLTTLTTGLVNMHIFERTVSVSGQQIQLMVGVKHRKSGPLRRYQTPPLLYITALTCLHFATALPVAQPFVVLHVLLQANSAAVCHGKWQAPAQLSANARCSC